MSIIERIDKLIWYNLLLFSLVCGVYRGASYVALSFLIVFGVVRFVLKPSFDFCNMPVLRSVCIFFSCIFLSVILSNDFFMSLQTFGRLLVSFIPMIVVYYIIKKNDCCELVFQLMAVSLALGSLIAIWQGLHGGVRVKSLLGMMNFAGALGLIFPIILVQAIEYRGAIFSKLIYWVAVILALPGAYYNGTRAIWLTMTGTILLYIIMRGKDFKKSIIAIIVAIIIVGAWGSGNNYIVEKIQSMTDVSTNGSNIGRVNLWQYSLDIFQKNPIFGIGYGVLPAFYGDVYKLDEKLTPNFDIVRGDHVHNNFLQLLAETGIVGAGAFFFWAISNFVFLWKKDYFIRMRRLSLIGVLVSVDFFFHGMFDYVLSPMGTSLFLFNVILGCVFAEKNCKKTDYHAKRDNLC